MLKPFHELLLALADGQSPLQKIPCTTTDAVCCCQLVGHAVPGIQLDPACPVHPAPRCPQVN